MTQEALRTGWWAWKSTWSPSSRVTYLLFWGGEHYLLPQSCFLGLFLSLTDQLPNEAPWDDREQGRGRGRWRALVLFPNLFCRNRKDKAW